MPRPGESDPSRTRLFYYLLALVFSIFLSLATYALSRVTAINHSLSALETWRDFRAKDVEKETAIVQQLRETVQQQQSLLLWLKERLATVENSVKFHEAQLDYLVEWDRHQKDAPFRRYPR